MSPSLLHPKCAMAWGGVSRCERCGNMPWICLDYSARKAQGAAQTPPSAQPAPTPSTPPTGAVAPLPWRTEYLGERWTHSTDLIDANDNRIGVAYLQEEGAFIIQAANHHAALVEVLEATVGWWDAWSNEELPDALRDTVLSARALLARVRGEP